MQDDDTTTPAVETDPSAELPTTEQPAAAAPPTTPPAEAAPAARSSIDGRTLGIAGIATAMLLLAFGVGFVVGGDDRRGHDERGPMQAGFAGGPDGGGQAMPGRGGGGRGGFDGPGGGPGERMEQRMGGRGNVARGEVTAVSEDSLTLESPRGDEVTVSLGEDTEYRVRGEDGPWDIEEASIDDIAEGDAVMVHGDRDDDGEDDGSATIEAEAVIVLADGE